LPCKLFGADLFLIDAVSNQAQFTHPVQVPDGFTGFSLSVPHPTDGELFVKLRDDPSAIHAVALAMQELSSAQEPAHLAARPTAAAAVSAPAPEGDAKPAAAPSPSAAAAPVTQPPPPQL
jgi:hypothetical protein